MLIGLKQIWVTLKLTINIWKDNYTFVRGAYNTSTNKGVDRCFYLSDEYEIIKTEEILEDLKTIHEQKGILNYGKRETKGIVSLKDTVPDSEIIRLGEVRNEPNYPIDDNYGIAGGYDDYSLVKKRIAYRTGTEEDGINNKKIIEYEIWEDAPCYVSTLEAIFNAYAKKINLTEFKSKKMKGNISELVEIHRNTQNMISKALKGIDTYLSNEQTEVCQLADTKQRLLNDIEELQKQKNNITKILDDIDRMHKEVKKATAIIVDRDKPKKRRLKLEE